MKLRANFGKVILSALLFLLSAAFIFPIIIVLINIVVIYFTPVFSYFAEYKK